MGRQRRKIRRNRISVPTRAKCGLHLSHLPLPFGARVDLNTFTRILLYTNDQTSDDEWHQIRRQLNQHDSEMLLFDNLEKCTEYIQKEYVEKLYLLVLKTNKLNMKNIKQTIIDACPSEQLTHFYVLNGRPARIDDEEIVMHGTCEDDGDDDDENNLEKTSGIDETFVSMAIYGLAHGHEVSVRDLTSDQVRFVWFQLLIDVLLRLTHSSANMNDMLEVARAHYCSDPVELNKINEFARDYRSTNSILWYTNDSFVYRLLNRAFRTQDIRIIFTFRFFILDLYRQLADEARGAMTLSKKAFRGQFLPVEELNIIRNSIGGLISTNTFLSTTTDSSVAAIYAGEGSRLPSHASVVFEIDLKSSDIATSFERPFASIVRHSSKKDEKEILFSMGTIFRVISVEEYDSTWLICLQMETQVKDCLTKLSAHLRTDSMHPIPSELTLGDFLLSMGELHQAEQFYAIMLRQEASSYDNALLFNSIGLLHIDRGNYRAARTLFEQAYETAKYHPSLMSSVLNNFGLAELNQGRYDRALNYFQRATKCNQSTKRLGSIFSNIAATFLEKGQLKKARNYLRRALSLDQKHLPHLHFDFGHIYGNLGVVELKMGYFKESLDLFEKCLSIYRQSLPCNHYLTAHVLNNLGVVHSEIGELDRAREYYEQALSIQTSAFERMKDQHLLIAQSLNNLATLQFEKENFTVAESLFQRALDVKLEIEGLDSDSHPSLANAYNNLAMVQLKQSHFEKAMANFERTLNIELPIGNAANIAITYNNIGGIHHEKRDFIMAKRFYKKARSNALIVLPPNHPSVELYGNNLEKARKMIKKDRLTKGDE